MTAMLADSVPSDSKAETAQDEAKFQDTEASASFPWIPNETTVGELNAASLQNADYYHNRIQSDISMAYRSINQQLDTNSFYPYSMMSMSKSAIKPELYQLTFDVAQSNFDQEEEDEINLDDDLQCYLDEPDSNDQLDTKEVSSSKSTSNHKSKASNVWMTGTAMMSPSVAMRQLTSTSESVCCCCLM